MGGKISAPRATSSPDPAYTKEARKAGIQGSVVLWAIVDVDGRAKDIKVTKSLDPGLDRSAIETVSRWKFKPAKKDGVPVRVQITIEVRFRL